MKARRYVRTAGALGHLLLVVVLALGVFVMHSVGHPTGSAHSAPRTASHAGARDGVVTGHAPMTALAGPGGVVMQASSPHSPSSSTPHHSASSALSPSALSSSASSHEPAMAMDMTSLCVAVMFGAWVLTALLASAFARHRESPAEALAGIAATPRPDPPPRRPDLVRLSVLRL